MIEMFHRIGSRIRNHPFLVNQKWFLTIVEPLWQKFFIALSNKRGYSARINQDEFKLIYRYGSRYDRSDKREYEPVLYGVFTGAIKEKMTVLDIGAHIGILSLAAAKRVGNEGKVYAFEASPDTADILGHHININGFKNRVEVVRAAASDNDGVVSFFVYRDSMAASMSKENVGVLNPERPDDMDIKKVETPAVMVDSFCKDRNIRPDIIKIDVEGAELRVLRGAKGIIMSEGPVIICEVHPTQMENCGSSIVEFEEFLEEVGYGMEKLEKPNKIGIFQTILTRRQ